MTERQTTGQKLLALKRRAGDPSLEAIAKAGGYARKSSVQEYFKASFDGPLTIKAAEKLADALSGKGNPLIERAELISLSENLPATNAVPLKMDGPSSERAREDLPIYGSALGAVLMIEGDAIEQTTLNTGDVIQYAKRPVMLNGRSAAYGLYVAGSSMYPAHADGDMVVVDPKSPLRIGDDVIVYLRPNNPDDDDGQAARCVLLKRLVRRTAHYLELEQFRPEKIFRIDMSDVVQIHRVLTVTEILS